MRKLNATRMWPLLMLALSSCASSPTVQVAASSCPTVQPAPPEVMVPRPSNFRERLQQIFTPSPTTPTPLSPNSPPAKP